MASIVVFSFGFPAQALSNDNANDRVVRDNASENRTIVEHAPGQVIIKLNEGVSLDDDFMDKHQLKSAEKVLKADLKKNKKAEKEMKLRGLDRMYFVKVSSEENLMDVLEELNNDPRVAYAEPDYVLSIGVIPNDPGFSSLWGFDNTEQTGGTADADIDAPEAWDIQTGSANVTIAVVDTGVDYTHPDLVANMWINEAELNGIPGVDDDNNTFIDDVYGYDFCNNDGDPMDDNNHGTHCAGTIGAVGNNNIGVVGVNHNVSIMPIKAFNSGGYAWTSDCILAIQYAILMDADIISNSWGGGSYSQALYDIIAVADDAGILFVAAAGNSGSNNDLFPRYPASYDVPNIVAVAATDHNDNKAYFSCYGLESVDLGAPGVSINSTLKNGGYGTYSGTSMACPHVAGAAGLVKAQNLDFGSDEIKEALLTKVDVIPSMEGKTVSGGRLNVYNSLENDIISPADITNLVITNVKYTSIDLTWTAVGDDDLDGVANSYDVRYSTEEITDISWDDALQASGEPIPGISGSVENFTVENLKFDTKYHFAIKAVDNAGNVAGLSNIASGGTITPVVAFSDDIESSESGWTFDGLWHHETYRSSSPVSSYAYNDGYPNYTYSTGSSNSGSLTSPMIDLSDLDLAILSFGYLYQTEYTGAYYDQRQVQIGVNGTFIEIAKLSGDQMLQWNTHIIDMSSYVGQDNIQIRFFFDTKDGIWNDFEGWYIDDVFIYGQSSGGNLLPIAIGQNQTVSDGDNNSVEIVTLNGSESFDSDGEVALFVWYEGEVALGNGALLNYEFPIGTYDLTLVVQDNNGAIATDEVVITVNPNQPPIANAGEDQVSFVGEQVVFNGSESFDPDGNIVSLEWDFGDGTGASGPVVNSSYNTAGNYTVTLTVTDNGGAIAMDTANFEAVAIDVVTVTKAQYDNKKDEIKFQATSSDGGAAVLEVFNTSDGLSYGQMTYNFEGDFFRLTAENVTTHPGSITVVSSLGGENTVEVTNKFKENQGKNK